MKTKDIMKLAGDERCISGIYNYCDRWCDRCAFTSRCLTTAMSEEDDDDPASRDIGNEAFWRNLQAILQQTREMILAWADEQGIDLGSLDVESVAEGRQPLREAEDHELAQLAQRYAELVDRWFHAEQTPLISMPCDSDIERQRSLENQAAPDVADDVHDALEVIGWYQHLISVNIVRGIMESRDEEPDPEYDWQKSSDGVIKVALIGMDRSIMAWGMLLGHFPDKTAGILPILAHLERLRRRTERAFPEARKFLRPGFDMMPSRFVN